MLEGAWGQGAHVLAHVSGKLGSGFADRGVCELCAFCSMHAWARLWCAAALLCTNSRGRCLGHWWGAFSDAACVVSAPTALQRYCVLLAALCFLG